MELTTVDLRSVVHQQGASEYSTRQISGSSTSDQRHSKTNTIPALCQRDIIVLLRSSLVRCALC